MRQMECDMFRVVCHTTQLFLVSYLILVEGMDAGELIVGPPHNDSRRSQLRMISWIRAWLDLTCIAIINQLAMPCSFSRYDGSVT